MDELLPGPNYHRYTGNDIRHLRLARSLPYACRVMLRIVARAPLAALLFLTACGAAPIAPVTVSLTDSGLQVPPAHRAAVEEIVTIMRQQLELPVPERVTVFVYDS